MPLTWAAILVYITWPLYRRLRDLLRGSTALAALFPFGTPFVRGTLGIGLILADHPRAGVGLLLWGGLVVSSIDNFVRPLLISSATRVPFLMVLLGVLGGVAAFGLLGRVIGPVLLAVLTAVWREWVKRGVEDLKPGAAP